MKQKMRKILLAILLGALLLTAAFIQKNMSRGTGSSYTTPYPARKIMLA